MPIKIGTRGFSLNGDIELNATNAIYFGDETTNGSWRIVMSGNDFSLQRRESDVWVEKSAFTP